MSSIKVRLKFLSPYLRDLAKTDEEEVLLRDNPTVKDLLGKLLEVHGIQLYEQLFDEETNNLRSGVLVTVNNNVVWKVHEELRDGDIVAVVLVYEGG